MTRPEIIRAGKLVCFKSPSSRLPPIPCWARRCGPVRCGCAAKSAPHALAQELLGFCLLPQVVVSDSYRLPPDTIDLQAHDAPSAQRHHRPAPDGSLAPHQAETLREVAAEAAEENLRSPQVSWNHGPDDPQQQHALAIQSAAGAPEQTARASNMPVGAQQDALAIAQNGGLSGHEADDAELDGDAEADMDDDMMDRISSSPSIEDGGSTLALPSLSSSNRLGPCSPPAAVRPGVSDPRSSSPYLESPDHLPLKTACRGEAGSLIAQSPLMSVSSRHHHLCGGFQVDDRVAEQTPPETCGLPHSVEWRVDGYGLEEDDLGYKSEKMGTTVRERSAPAMSMS